jgi:tryptophanyl-tRNA synthetase
MPRRLTGFTPSGNLHLGNYLGAMCPIITQQASTDSETAPAG